MRCCAECEFTGPPSKFVGVICRRCYSAKYRQNNRSHLRDYIAEWKIANQDHLKEWRRQYFANRIQNDMHYKLRSYLRRRLKSAVKDELKAGSAVSDLGCSIEELKKHLETKFQPGMSWDNWTTNGWHVDHIRPLSSFDLTDPEQFKQACHYTNLQPLWAKDNLSKGDNL